MNGTTDMPEPRHKRWAGLRAVALVGSVLAAACTTGRKGAGEVKGSLFVYGCKANGDDLGKRGEPAPYDLDPDFFAGEPLEDLRTGVRPENRLIIRLQSSGKQIEVNDTLMIYITNSYEVARCVRGRKTRLASGEEKPDYNPMYCWWGDSGMGPARVRVGRDLPVSASLGLRDTCPGNVHVVGTALAKQTPAVPPENWESWIELSHFGSATERDEIKTTFRVSFDERIHAPHFRFTLQDDQIPKAIKRLEPPPAFSEIEGTLEGYFDFDLERGQGYQAFP